MYEEYYDYYEDERQYKYPKKRESSKSKSMLKSKHKHMYKQCLLIEDGKPHLGNYCEICGRINDVKFKETELNDDGTYHNLTDDEIYERHKDLEQIEVESIWQKFVPVVQEG